jgi:2-oxoglutarate dehydrogenase E1 component
MPETATVQITMPEMGESVTEGIVLEWHVAEGDSVKEGDTVVEVSTDKVDAEVPAPADGVITKLIAAVDDEVPVGAPLAEMEAGGEGQSPQRIVATHGRGAVKPWFEWRRRERERRCAGHARCAEGG